MSDDNNASSEPSNSVEPKEEFVSKKAYEDMQRDMHKYKAKSKSISALNAEYEAKLKAAEDDRLVENEQWKELAQKTKKELETYKSQSIEDKNKYLKSVKMQALKQELGGNVKDIYLSHANIADIEINSENGLVDNDSLLQVANAFRNDHSVLLQKTKGGNPTGPAASEHEHVEKPLSDISIQERKEMLRTKINNNRS